jgi:hypothetical protein
MLREKRERQKEHGQKEDKGNPTLLMVPEIGSVKPLNTAHSVSQAVCCVGLNYTPQTKVLGRC